jgi:hypothetical protein
MNLPPSVQQVTAPRQLAVHLDSTFELLNMSKPQKLYYNSKKSTLPDVNLDLDNHAFIPV